MREIFWPERHLIELSLHVLLLLWDIPLHFLILNTVPLPTLSFYSSFLRIVHTRARYLTIGVAHLVAPSTHAPTVTPLLLSHQEIYRITPIL